MEDIEDLLAGGNGGAPPGFRLPLNAVGINPKTSKSKRVSSKQDQITASNRDSLAPPSMKIPGTQAMFERMKAEKEEGRRKKEEGRGGERTSEQELRRKLEKLSERLSKLNTYSSWLNILTLMSLTWHFVYLGQRLGAAC